MLRLKKPDRTRWDDRKLDHVRPHLDAAEAKGRFGVVAIVAGQEFSGCSADSGQTWPRGTELFTVSYVGPIGAPSASRRGCTGRRSDHFVASQSG